MSVYPCLCVCMCVGVHVYLCLCVSFQFQLSFKFLFPLALKSRQRFLYAASFVSLNHTTHICLCLSLPYSLLAPLTCTLLPDREAGITITVTAMATATATAMETVALLPRVWLV